MNTNATNGGLRDSGRSDKINRSGKVALYAAVGAALVHYDVDVESCTLVRTGTVSAPENITYAWPDPALSHLYTASSNGSPGVPGNSHHLTAFRIDRISGALGLHGPSAVLPARPVHMTLDIPGDHALATYNAPLLATVHRIAGDGTIGEEVRQAGGLDVGFFPHQIRVAPCNEIAIVVSRGNRPAPGKPEEPGALKVFDFRDGVLTSRATVAPRGGFGFGPRHLDFHPTRPWVYVALELQNKIHVYSLTGNTLGSEPLFIKETLRETDKVAPHQVAGSVHVHPGGKFVYTVNRASGTVDFEGRPFFAGGVNDIAVFAINEETGEPTLIQNVDTRGIHSRTFSIDPSGRMLVAANISAFEVRDGSERTMIIPACLSTYRIGSDGKLEFVSKYDVETTGKQRLFWMCVFGLN